MSSPQQSRTKAPTAVRLSLPYAFRPLADTRLRHIAAHGGRGGAKSHSFGQVLVTRGAKRPLRWLCCREIQRSIGASVKQLLEDKIRAAQLQDFYRVTQYSISASNGTEFLFAGLRSNPESIKSMEGLDGAWVEEANTVSQRSIDLLVPTLRKPGSQIWWSWNRRFKTDPVDHMFLGEGGRQGEKWGGPPPRSAVFAVHHDDNPWFPDELKEEMEWCRKHDYDKYLHVWRGQPVRSSASKVFKNWRIADIDDEVPAGTVPRFGADWGFSIDPSVLVKVLAWGRTLYIREEAWKLGCKIQDRPKMFQGVSESQRYPIRADSASPDTIAYMRDHGFPLMMPAKKGPGSVEEGIAFMQSHEIVVHPSCTHAADELATYSYKTDKLTEEVLPDLEDKDNHVIDGVRYALEAYRRGQSGPGVIIGGQLVEG